VETLTTERGPVSTFYILLAVFALSCLVIVHEAGHYFVARACGMRVTRFSIGFGPVLVRYRPRNSPTTFQVGVIPLFAYVMIAGMGPLVDEDPNDAALYANKGLLARIAVVAGGPFANYLAACALVFGVAVGHRQLPVAAAARVAVTHPCQLTLDNVHGIADLFARRTTEGLTGPVGMSKLMAQQAEQGALPFLHLLIALSVAMGLFNLLPFPFLDGGRLVFLGYELVTRRRANPHIEGLVHAIGMLLLLGTMTLVTFRELVL
jgi:membrane-associated protease RseP (regulator of RpoE activity)